MESKPINEEDQKLLSKILAFKQSLSEEHDIDLVISAVRKDSEFPLVAYHGDMIRYTALASTVAKELRDRVIAAIDGTSRDEVRIPEHEEIHGSGSGSK
jgi:ribonuclease HII